MVSRVADSQLNGLSPLCNHCLKFFQPKSYVEALATSDTPRTASVLLEKKLSDVTKCAQWCVICKIILENTDAYDDESPDIKMEFICGTESHDIKRIHLLYQGPVSDDSNSGFATGHNQRLQSYIVHSLPNDPAARFVKTRPVEVDVGSSTSIETARLWLQQCCSGHQQCSQAGNRIMPTRCLKVEDLDRIHLCITGSQGYPYAALSYCWGPKEYPNLVTVKDSLQQMTENIPLSSFPLTLRDGIVIANQLGLSYLWIDAVCIIQDDEADKDDEIPQMRRIFSNAHCTIIAATAAHCHAGFIHSRDLPSFPELCVPYPGPVENGQMILRQRVHDGWTLYDPLDDPINERAWTLEERLLSPRRLIFSKNHLRWLCETSEHTNGGDVEDRKFPSSGKRLQIERLPPQLSPRIDTLTTAQSSLGHDIWYSWLDIVLEYNLRALTKSKDKLRAIGGIAELYHLKTGDKYCAGLWRSHLAQELLWKVEHPRATFSSMIVEARDPTSISLPTVTLFPRPPKYRAPTWSWASVTGTTANHRAITRLQFVMDVFEIIDCVVIPEKSTAPLISVKSAVLTVRGRVKNAILHIQSQLLYESDEACTGEDYFGDCHLDALEHKEHGEYRAVYCLEITSRVRDGFVGNQQGLALVEADERTYKRIGTFGTHALDISWFEKIEPQTLKIV